MIRTLAALKSLRREPGHLNHNPLARPVDPAKECDALLKALDHFRQAGSTIRFSQPRLNPQEVWRDWQRSGFRWEALNGLQVRTLCTAEETALRRELIVALENHPEVLGRTVCLFGLALAYFSQWRLMADPERVETVIAHALQGSERSNAVITCWKSNRSLFSKSAAPDLATEAVRHKADTSELLSARFVPVTSNLGVAVAANVAELATTEFRREEMFLNQEQLLARLKWIHEVAWKAPVPSGSFYRSASQFILSKSSERSDSFCRSLIECLRFDSRLGDPRDIANRPKWLSVDPNAAQLFLSWLARDNIIFFFNTILPDSSQNRRRKDFWLRYKGSVRDFQVAVSEHDLEKIRRSLPEREMPFFSKVNHPTTSAFLMRIVSPGADYIIVEFSETGNAAYIYESKTFERGRVSLRSLEFSFERDLKHAGRLERITHVGEWEYKARRVLAELGIRP